MIRFKENAPCFKWIVRCGFLLLLIFQSTFSPRKLKVKPQFVPQTLVCLHCKYLFGISWVFFFCSHLIPLVTFFEPKQRKRGEKSIPHLRNFSIWHTTCYSVLLAKFSIDIEFILICIDLFESGLLISIFLWFFVFRHHHHRNERANEMK